MILPYFSPDFFTLFCKFVCISYKKIKKYICAIPFNKRKKCSYFQGQTRNDYLSKYYFVLKVNLFIQYPVLLWLLPAT